MAFEIPPPGNVLVVPIIRLAGKIGIVVAFWETEPVTADTEDFGPHSGNVTFHHGQVRSFKSIKHLLLINLSQYSVRDADRSNCLSFALFCEYTG